MEANYLELKKDSPRFVTIDARKPLEDVIAKCLKMVKVAIGKENAPKISKAGTACWDDDDKEEKKPEDDDQSSE